MDATLKTARRVANRSETAKGLISAAVKELTACTICHHKCRVDRTAGPAGRCGAAAEPRTFSAQVEVGDELEIVPAYAVALSGCNMRCDFCITGNDSWHPQRGESRSAVEIGKRANLSIHNQQSKSLLILGGEPTIHPTWLLELAAEIPDSTPLVLKTNGLTTEIGRGLLAGIFDTWIVDLKFGNDQCAQQLSHTSDYLSAVRETLIWVANHTELIIRHLLMPGHIECCWEPTAAWISQNLPGQKVSLRAGFWPTWHASKHPSLNRPLEPSEHARGLEIARSFNLNLIS